MGRGGETTMIEISEYTLRCDICKENDSTSFQFETKEQLEKFLSQEKWITYRSAIDFKDYHLCLKHKNLALGKVSINTKGDNSNVSNS